MLTDGVSGVGDLTQPQQSAHPLQAFWRTLTRVDKSKINTWIAVRNAAAVAIPLAVGIALHNPLGAVAVSVGALNVSYSDGTDPYRHRAARMLLWTGLSGIAVFTGSATGSISWLAVIVASAWAVASGLAVSISSKAGDLGLNTLVSLIVFAARGATTFVGALETAGLVIAGGLLQTGFSLLFWPVRRHDPQRRVLGQIYMNLSKELAPSTPEAFESQLRAPSQLIQDTLYAIGRDHSIEGERFRLLSDQTDRIRLSTFVVRQLRDRLRGQPSTELEAAILDDVLQTSSELLRSIAQAILSDDVEAQQARLLERIESNLELAATSGEAARAIAVLAGQLRLAAALSRDATLAGSQKWDRDQLALPSRLRLSSWWGTIRANLNWMSSSFRHAVRLAACVAIGDAIGRSISLQRSYWIPMTIAVVLKPDFATTFSRGVLRLCGTFVGLLLATGLYHLLPESNSSELAITQLILVGLFTYALRSIGPANYGVFTVAVSGLIVFLVAATGISPRQVVVLRAISTAAGGLFALLAYALWPTWERSQSREVLAQMLDRIRVYFHAISADMREEPPPGESDLDALRTDWRLARTNAEASVDRLEAEPVARPQEISCLTSILASSRAVVRSMMGMEAALSHQSPLGQTPHSRVPEAFRKFARDVEFTLYFAANALRGSKAASEVLPQLREDQRRLAEELDPQSPEDELLRNQSDRLTVSLNTLREQVERCVSR